MRYAVEIALKELPELSQSEIANVCAVSRDLVQRLQPAESAHSKVTGREDKSYPVRFEIAPC